MKLDKNGVILLDKEIEEIKANLKQAQEIEREERKQISDDPKSFCLKTASERATYGITLSTTTMYEQNIKRLLDLRKDIELVERGTDRTIADIGDLIRIRYKDGTTNLFVLTANHASNTIGAMITDVSINSPLGQSIYQKKADEAFSFKLSLALERVSGKIVSIESPTAVAKKFLEP
ncbi:MAG: hypothetical protein FWD89_01450 [Firmicutes bacterium]|nr:hypothetical protein [Bacillota bacterium]